MLSKISAKRRQAGDTIVEVLICIAVISTVLTGAFIVVSKSNRAVQDSAEHAQAQQRLQGEIESLRAYLAGASNTDSVSGNFCFDGSNTPVAVTDATCKTDNGGGAEYSLSISPTGTPNTYKCTISWESITGSQANETYYYQVYPKNG